MECQGEKYKSNFNVNEKIANNFTTASTDFNSFSIDYFLYYYTSITI